MNNLRAISKQLALAGVKHVIVAASKDTVKVIFRKEKSGQFKGYVTAVFPETYDKRRSMFETYAHVGQHSEGSLAWYQSTIAAKPEEYVELLKELRGVYDDVKLKVVQKFTRLY